MDPIVKIGTVSAGYGVTSTVHKNPHNGIDFVVPEGTPLHAPMDGVISRIADYGDVNLGKAVFVKMQDGTQYVLGHLSDIKVKVGQVIHQGDLLALSGNTGRSTGAHLHFGMYDTTGKAINPGNTSFESFGKGIKEMDPAWWDLPGQAVAAAEAVKEWAKDQIHQFFDWSFDILLSFLDVAFPTAACLGLLWWMFPCLPKSHKGAKLTGASLVLYMFYVLIRSVG